MTSNHFSDIVTHIIASDTYENPDNWEARGLNPSDQDVISLLRKTTNDFLESLEVIYKSDESPDTKQKRVSQIFDALPWRELDTEEKEFLADTLYPAIKASGIDPEKLF